LHPDKIKSVIKPFKSLVFEEEEETRNPIHEDAPPERI